MFISGFPATDGTMASSSSQSEKARIPPVFVFPSLIEFFEDDPTTHKRVLTIYNPYDYEVAFKGSCTFQEASNWESIELYQPSTG